LCYIHTYFLKVLLFFKRKVLGNFLRFQQLIAPIFLQKHLVALASTSTLRSCRTKAVKQRPRTTRNCRERPLYYGTVLCTVPKIFVLMTRYILFYDICSNDYVLFCDLFYVSTFVAITLLYVCIYCQTFFLDIGNFAVIVLLQYKFFFI
jgi:hypothetical protein